MTLTVPRAGTDAGRAARPVFDEPQTGNVIQAFGDQMAQIGDRLETDRLDREMRRLQVDMTKDLNDLRLQAEEIGDPDELDQFWSSGVQGLKQRYLTGTRDNGRAIVDPKHAEDWELGFDDLANRHGFAIGQNALALRQSQRIGTHIEYRNVVSQQMATTDAATAEELARQYDASLADLEARGIISPEERAADSLAIRAAGDVARLTRIITDPDGGPEAALAIIAEGGLSASAEDITKLELYANRTIAERDKEIAREAEVARKDWEKATEGELREGIAIEGAGGLSAQRKLLEDPVVREAFPDLVAEFEGNLALQEDGKLLPKMTLAELRALRDDVSGTEVNRKYQTQMLAAVDAQIERSEKGWREDPVGFALENGLLKGDLDFASGTTLATTLARRQSGVALLVEEGHIDTPVYLTPSERERLRESTSVEVDPVTRLEAGRAVVAALGGTDPAAVEDILEDPVLTGVSMMRGARIGTDTLARQILEGQRIAASKDVREPPLATWRQAFFGEFDGLFADGVVEGLGDETGARNQLMSMAWGYYLYNARGDEEFNDGKLKPEALRQAFHTVAGGTGAYDSRNATGGVQSIRGRATFLPPGVRGRDVDAKLNGIQIEINFGQMGSDDWKAISATGGVPRVGRAGMDASTWSRLQLRAAGGTAYHMVWQDPDTGGFSSVWGDDGRPFLLDLGKLMTRLGDEE